MTESDHLNHRLGKGENLLGQEYGMLFHGKFEQLHI